MTRFDGEVSPAFEIMEPAEWRAPVIFNSPHSGSTYPDEFLTASRIDLPQLRRSEDSFMDELIGHLSGRGFPTVRVNFPRSYVDVNREPYELDPRMFTGRLPSFANTRSMRVAGGLGTIPRVVGDGQEIYRERILVDDALARIETLYKPYHRALRRLINKVHQMFGTVVLVDCHSMPSVGVSRDEPRRPDIVIGDRYGTSCTPLLPDRVEETMTGLGYSIGRNKPYAGGFITEHYGAACTPCSSSSTARSTWTSGGANAVRALRRWQATSVCSPTCWRRRFRSAISARSRPRRNRRELFLRKIVLAAIGARVFTSRPTRAEMKTEAARKKGRF
jgi:N-formylglutamate amidohydrolase